MTKKKTLTIGIPAYNEGANISALIRSVLTQRSDKIEIAKIIVSSDGSTDKTVDSARSVVDKRVRVFANRDRQGIARGLNQIINNTNTDILVTLDADIKITDKKFLEKLIMPIIKEGADHTSSAIAALPAKSFVAKCLFLSMRIKDRLFASLENPNNLYTCHGLARGYSKRFYSKLTFPVSIGNDMYGYLACKIKGLKYLYAPDAVCWYRLPETYGDHKKQSMRFGVSAAEQGTFVDNEIVSDEVTIPLKNYFSTFIGEIPTIAINIHHFVGYLLMQVRIKSESSKYSTQETWSISESSKKL